MNLIAYVRASADDQGTALQLDALRLAGAKEVFQDPVDSSSSLSQAVEALKPGDVLVVWRLDRIGRSLAHLIELVSMLNAKGCGLRSLTETIDTTAAGGDLVFRLFGAIAQFEHEVTAERARVGLQAAKKRGVKLGRRKVLTAQQVERARQLIDGGESASRVAACLDVDRSTLYRALASLSSSSSKT